MGSLSGNCSTRSDAALVLGIVTVVRRVVRVAARQLLRITGDHESSALVIAERFQRPGASNEQQATGDVGGHEGPGTAERTVASKVAPNDRWQRHGFRIALMVSRMALDHYKTHYSTVRE